MFDDEQREQSLADIKKVISEVSQLTANYPKPIVIGALVTMAFNMVDEIESDTMRDRVLDGIENAFERLMEDE